MKALIEVKESRGEPGPGRRGNGTVRLASTRSILRVQLEPKRKGAPARKMYPSDVARAIEEIVMPPAAFDFGKIPARPPAKSEAPPARAADLKVTAGPQAIEEVEALPTVEGAAEEGAPREAEEKEIPRAPATPSEDPAFLEAKSQVVTEATKQKRHAPAKHKRIEAEKASALPEDEQKDQSAKEKSTAEMEEAAKQQEQAQKRSAEAFKSDLKQRIIKQMEERRPKSESSAKELAKQPVQFEPEFSNKVDAEQGKVIGPLRKEADPTPSGGVVEKVEAPIPDPVYPSAPKPVDPKLVIPKPRTDEEISLQHESNRLDDVMRENRLSDEQLAESREPSFIETLELKQEAQRKVEEAPAGYRQREEEVLSGVETTANESMSKDMEGMKKTRRRSGGAVHDAQGRTETTTEKRQREIKETIDSFYNQTVIDVEKILTDMTTKVKKDFADRLEEKTNAFNEAVRSSISKYYGDWRIDDELFGPDPVVVLPDGSTRSLTSEEIRDMLYKGKKVEVINPDVYRIFLKEKNNFVEAMNEAIDNVAGEVEKGLTDAHLRIQKGEGDIAGFKNTLKGDERTYAEQLEQEARLKFDNLKGSIDDAREDLLQTLADQYVENVDQLEKTFKEINDELKKSWIDRAIEFIVTVGKTIFQLAELLFTILVRVAYLVWDIIKHPIRFFETLVSGLMQGIGNFIENIGTYLEEAFWSWITGASPVKNIRLSPGSGVEGLFDLVLQVLNLGSADLRAIVERILGKEFMQMVDRGVALGERALEPVIILITKGPLAFWEYVKETLAGIVQSSFDRIKETVFYAFVEKGLKWIAGFFVPGGGFVKIVKAIFSAFQFVAANLENIRQFFDSVFDSMEAAVKGETEGVAGRIVTGLKLGVVLALDFLAKLLGLNKIIDSVQKIIQSLRRPIVKAIEWVLHKTKPFVMKLMRAGKKLLERGKAAVGKVLGWLGIKKSFRDKEGEAHKLFFRGSEQQPQLMIESDAIHIGSWMPRRKQELRDAGKLDSGMNALFNSLTKLMQEITSLTYDDGKVKRPPAEVVDNLSEVIAKIGVTGEHPVPRMLVEPGFSSAKANGLNVRYLFNDKNNHRKGDPSDGKGDLHGAFTEINALGLKRFWDRAHLLNAEFGGTADNSNLIPMPKSTNLGIYKSFDRGIREMYYDKKVVWVGINISRNHENDPDEKFVSSLKASAGMMNFDNSSKAWIKGEEKVPLDLDSSHLPRPQKVAQSAVSINDAIRSKISDREEVRNVARLNGITERLMEALIQRGITMNNVDELRAYIKSRTDWSGPRAERMLNNLDYAISHGQLKLG